MVLSPTLLRITAHSTPHQSDPPDAHEFYAALGMFAVAWGRLEGHVTGNLLTIMNFPELADGLGPLPLTWDKRLDLWTRAFDKVPALQPHKLRATAFMKSLKTEAEDRNFAAHAIWDEFVADASEPTIISRTVRPKRGSPQTPKRGSPQTIEVADYCISLSLLKRGLAEANRLNLELVEFTALLRSVRPPPADARKA
jgi:hypothetical protein